MSKAETYFTGEKRESLLFIFLALSAIMVSLYFWLGINNRFLNGIAWPLFLIALIQLSVGLFIYLRSPADLKRVSKMLRSNPKNALMLEIPRMEVVMKKFVLYRYIEGVLLLFGLVLFFVFDAGSFYKGFGLGLSVQSLIMLLADGFAARRGNIYLSYLRSLNT